jgi:hypothetical protein
MNPSIMVKISEMLKALETAFPKWRVCLSLEQWIGLHLEILTLAIAEQVLLLFFPGVLGMELRALWMLGKGSTTEPLFKMICYFHKETLNRIPSRLKNQVPVGN